MTVNNDSFWLEGDLAKECVSLYGYHRTRLEVKGKIGYLRYCEICGTGRWVNMKNEVKLEEGIHYEDVK